MTIKMTLLDRNEYDAAGRQITLEGIDRFHAEIARLRAALHEIIGLDHHNHGPESRATKIARDAIANEQLASPKEK